MVRVAKLGTLELPLASWLPANEQYERHYRPVDPESETVSGDRPGLQSNVNFRTFAVRSWRGGEGITTWEREARQYRQSTNVRPVSIRDGLELGAAQSVTEAAGGGTFNNAGARFGLAQGKLWVGRDGDGHAWDTADEHWDAGVTTGGGTSDFSSMVDGDDTWIYTGHSSTSVWRWKSGSQEEHVAASALFSRWPVLRAWGGVIYALDGDQLYEIDKTAADTITQRADLEGSSAVYLDSVPWSFGRMSSSDRGPIWLQRLDNGQTFLWLYDQNNDSQERLGKISVDFVFPYSLFFTHGFVFAGIRYAPAHDQEGDAYLWFKRGAQDGYAGPFRSTTGVTASKPIFIGGVIGDDLIVYFDAAIWAYNLTDGGIYQMAAVTTTEEANDVVTLGKDIFISAVTDGANTHAVERFETDRYTTETASIDLGKHDWDYPGLVKILYDVTVITDPLPANTSIQPAVSADGAAFTNIGSASATDNETHHRFVVSSSAGSTISGVEFELRLLLSTTNAANTPTVREVSARATGAEKLLQIVLRVDCGKSRPEAAKFLTALNALAEPSAPAVLSLTDPYQLGEKETPTAFDVTLEDVIEPAAFDDQSNTDLAATVVVQAVELR